MLDSRDRDLCVEVSRTIHKEMVKEIEKSNHKKASELGTLWDNFVIFCGRLEAKDEVL